MSLPPLPPWFCKEMEGLLTRAILRNFQYAKKGLETVLFDITGKADIRSA